MFNELEKPFLECVNKVINNENLFKKSSIIFLLAFALYEDSFFSEIYPNISYDNIVSCINKIDLNDDIQYIYDKAKKMAFAEENNEVYDEYILFAVISNECDALKVLKLLDVDIEGLKRYIKNDEENEDKKFLTNLTKLALNGKIKPYIGRQYYIEKVIRILNKKEKCNPLLIGSAGVGKSALVEGVVNYLVENKIDLVVYRLDLGAIVAGTRYRGDLEERLMEVLKKVQGKNIVLFIDEIHTIINSGSSEGGLDIASILKPALARGEIKCIGATTVNEYYKYIVKDEALRRRFQNIFIPEASKEETFTILSGIRSEYEKYYDIHYPNAILSYIIEKSNIFLNKYYPDKAIDILDEAGALTLKNRSYIVSESIIDKIILENIGVVKKPNYDEISFKNLIKYYKLFFKNLNIRETIMNVLVDENNYNELVKDLNKVFSLTKNSIFQINNIYEECEDIYEHILKNPIAVFTLRYEEKIIKDFINLYFKEKKHRNISFRNSILVFIENNKKTVEIGYLKNKQCKNIHDLYIDEIITDKKISRRKVQELEDKLNKNNINVVFSKTINDENYEELIRYLSNAIEDNNRTHFYKDKNNKIKIKKTQRF